MEQGLYKHYYDLIKDYLTSYIYDSEVITDDDIYKLIRELDDGNKLGSLNKEIFHVASDLINSKPHEFLDYIRLILIPYVIKERNNYSYCDLINNSHINFIGKDYKDKYIKKYADIYYFVSNYLIENRKLLSMGDSNVNFAVWIISIDYFDNNEEVNKDELINYLNSFVDDVDTFIDSYRFNEVSGLFDKDNRKLNERKESLARYVRQYYRNGNENLKRIY